MDIIRLHFIKTMSYRNPHRRETSLAIPVALIHLAQQPIRVYKFRFFFVLRSLILFLVTSAYTHTTIRSFSLNRKNLDIRKVYLYYSQQQLHLLMSYNNRVLAMNLLLRLLF